MTSEMLSTSLERALDALPPDRHGALLPRPPAVVAHNFQRGRVARLRLSPKQRAAAIRHVYDAGPNWLTSLALESSEQAVQNQRHRGLLRLRQLLAAG